MTLICEPTRSWPCTPSTGDCSPSSDRCSRIPTAVKCPGSPTRSRVTQRRAESFPWTKPHSQSSQGTTTLTRPIDARAACGSADLCFRLCFRSCAEPIAEPTAHAISELTHSLCGGVLIAHRHAFTAVPEPLHDLSNCGTVLREPGGTCVSQLVVKPMSA